MKLGSALTAALAAVFILSAAGVSAEQLIIVGDEVATEPAGVSGIATENAVSVDLGNWTDRAFFLIRTKERWNRPCFMRLLSRPFPGAPGGMIIHDLDVCGDKYPSPLTAKQAALGEDRFMTGITVCTSNNRDRSKRRIKGLALAGRVLSDVEGTYIMGLETGASFFRPRCRLWRRKLECPALHVVTRLTAYYKTFPSGYNGFTGIALGCRQVRRGLRG